MSLMKKLGLSLFILALALVTTSAGAEVKINKSETYKDIIEKAYNLSLQKDRQQALTILASAIQRESRPQAVAELKKTVSDIANLFFSDKTQQLYEVAISLRKTDFSQALGKITEASRLEPDNSAIVNEQSRLLIIKGDCSGAQELAAKQEKLTPYDEEIQLTLAQASLCSSGPLTATTLDQNEAKKTNFQKFWLALLVEKAVKEKDTAKAQEILANLRKVDPKYPEIAYWNWKIDQILKRKSGEAAQKYVMTCKNISASQYRQYMIDPMLCRRIIEVEAEVKGANGATE